MTKIEVTDEMRKNGELERLLSQLVSRQGCGFACGDVKLVAVPYQWGYSGYKAWYGYSNRQTRKTVGVKMISLDKRPDSSSHVTDCFVNLTYLNGQCARFRIEEIFEVLISERIDLDATSLALCAVKPQDEDLYSLYLAAQKERKNAEAYVAKVESQLASGTLALAAAQAKEKELEEKLSCKLSKILGNNITCEVFAKTVSILTDSDVRNVLLKVEE